MLSTVAESFGGQLRAAVGLLAESVPEREAAVLWDRWYACRKVEPGFGPGQRSAAELCAWATVAAWTVGVTTGAVSDDARLGAAEDWFLALRGQDAFSACVRSSALVEAEGLLRQVADATALADLLPYVLDPHGEGSRLSVRSRPETAAARARKRADGVFYTPEDVAVYMATETLRDLGDDALPLTVFDPACGSGVFLRAVLAVLERMNPGADRFDLACSCLYGTDIDAWVVNAAAFVLLHDCWPSISKRDIAPISAWHALRLNLAQMDALRLEPGQELLQSDPQRLARLAIRASLKGGGLPAVAGNKPNEGPISFAQVFPELAIGPRIIIGNPPYADIASGTDMLSLAKRFETFRAAPRSSSDLYPLFLEQMVRLTAPDAHGGALVLPLSIACNSGRQFQALRAMLARTPGHWRFAFFDREPHALFGEDVKTRNAIVLWTRHGVERTATFSTGPLRKWRGQSRAQLFKSLDYTPIMADIRPCIPKVSGAAQASALAKLRSEGMPLARAVMAIGRATLAEALDGDATTVYVGSTAYNFLSVFLRPKGAARQTRGALTENPLHALRCSSAATALQTYALLNSRLAFWWWHAHGDGFHVSRSVLDGLPVGRAALDPTYADRLTELGTTLWAKVSAAPVLSVNRGRTSLGFSAVEHAERTDIDSLLVEALGLDPDFQAVLAAFCDEVMAVQTIGEVNQSLLRGEKQ